MTGRLQDHLDLLDRAVDDLLILRERQNEIESSIASLEALDVMARVAEMNRENPYLIIVPERTPVKIAESLGKSLESMGVTHTIIGADNLTILKLGKIDAGV